MTWLRHRKFSKWYDCSWLHYRHEPYPTLLLLPMNKNCSTTSTIRAIYFIVLCFHCKQQKNVVVWIQEKGADNVSTRLWWILAVCVSVWRIKAADLRRAWYVGQASVRTVLLTPCAQIQSLLSSYHVTRDLCVALVDFAWSLKSRNKNNNYFRFFQLFTDFDRRSWHPCCYGEPLRVSTRCWDSHQHFGLRERHQCVRFWNQHQR